jgi:hypothetical protein
VLDRSLIAMRHLIDRSLADVRVTAGLTPRWQLISVANLIAEVKSAMSLEAQDRGCELTVSFVDADLAVECDHDMLLAAVGNLLQNAFKFTQHGTGVSLTAYAAGDRIRIDVEDNCGGLPPGGAERMFLPFTQCGEDRSGLGLGLAICRRQRRGEQRSSQRARSAGVRVRLHYRATPALADVASFARSGLQRLKYCRRSATRRRVAPSTRLPTPQPCRGLRVALRQDSGSDRLAGHQRHLYMVLQTIVGELNDVPRLGYAVRALAGWRRRTELHEVRHRHGRSCRVCARLGNVHGSVGPFEKILCPRTVARICRSADARRHDHGMAADLKPLFQARMDLLGYLRHTARSIDLREKHDELVAAVARDGIRLADQRQQTLRHLLQELIAGRVSEPVVHGLEAVQVEQQQPNLLALSRGLGDRPAEPIQEQASIG